MAQATDIKGFDTVINNLNREIKAIQNRTMKGLLISAAFIREDMDKTPPLIPIDTENLRKSWFANAVRNGEIFGVIMGFSANYALFVHEMVGADFTSARWRYNKKKQAKKYWYTPREGAGAKFFEASIKRNTDKILQILKENVEIPK